MANKTNHIEQLINGGEGEQLDFKKENEVNGDIKKNKQLFEQTKKKTYFTLFNSVYVFIFSPGGTSCPLRGGQPCHASA